MSLAIIYTRAREGVNAPLVRVEVHISNGLPALNIVGLPETAVRESKDRVRSAIINSHLEFPARRITINLSPADLPKQGGRYDLAIAVGILAASKQLPQNKLAYTEFIGELGLDGELREVNGALIASIASTKERRSIVTPADNAAEAALASGSHVYSANNLLEVCAHLHDRENLPRQQRQLPKLEHCKSTDLADVYQQQQAKRALEIAAAGQHNLLFYGPPGTGKTLLASCMPSIMPPLNESETLETASIYSITKQQYILGSRPFRAPHHSASAPALVGGGSHPKPGEISLAHNGVLFLDEFPEFQRSVLEVLREPLESGEILISRAKHQSVYPARFQLLAAMNPCPCGYAGDKERECSCSTDKITRYRAKLSGPLLDRIDMQVEVNRVPPKQLRETQQKEEPSSIVRERVKQCQNIQLQRQQTSNSQLNNLQIKEYCKLDKATGDFFDSAAKKLQLSARAYFRSLKVARTIADLDQAEQINKQHLLEAINYRMLNEG